MLNITSDLTDGIVTVFVQGRIDSTNSPEVQNKIEELDTGTKLIIDLKGVEYVSSAGLRVFLRFRKKHKDLWLKNASTEVYDILDMTGFTEMMKVTRAYRRISVDGCEVIGQGANGKIYRTDPDTVVKVYLNPDALEEIEHERQVARKALVLGIPTAISYDVVEVDDYYASMFEMLNARSIAQRLAANPGSVDENAKLYVELLKLIHETEVPAGDLPDQLDVAKKWVSYLEGHIPQDVYEKICALVDEIPRDNHMIHGDYHVKNVMIQNGETLLIDMDTLAVGHPILEMASVYNAYKGFYLLDRGYDTCQEFLGVSHDTILAFYKKVMELYYDSTDDEYLELIENKAKVIGLVRLLRRSLRRNLPAEEIECYKTELLDAVSKVDTLL